jgi:hypothetical protein
MTPKQPVEAFSPQDLARRRKRSIAMAIGLALLMLLFFITTLVRLGANMADKVS